MSIDVLFTLSYGLRKTKPPLKFHFQLNEIYFRNSETERDVKLTTKLMQDSADLEIYRMEITKIWLTDSRNEPWLPVMTRICALCGIVRTSAGTGALLWETL